MHSYRLRPLLLFFFYLNYFLFFITVISIGFSGQAPIMDFKFIWCNHSTRSSANALFSLLTQVRPNGKIWEGLTVVDQILGSI